MKQGLWRAWRPRTALARQSPWAALAALAPLAFLAPLLFLGSMMMGGCLSAADTSADSSPIDPFPKPLGEALIPLERQAFSTFRYVEYDSAGGLVFRKDLTLQILPKAKDVYGYAFEDPRRGLLLTWKDGDGNRDSAGIYILGSFRDSALAYNAVPVLWLPQFPKPGVAWSIEPGRVMTLASSDTAFYTEVLFNSPEEAAKAPIAHGFQRHSTLLFRETSGDTLTSYHFRRGVGMLGFERSARGRLIASGYIKSFFGGRYYGSIGE